MWIANNRYIACDSCLRPANCHWPPLSCTCVYLYRYTYIYTYVCVCVCMCVYVCMHACKYVCMYACTHILSNRCFHKHGYKKDPRIINPQNRRRTAQTLRTQKSLRVRYPKRTRNAHYLKVHLLRKCLYQWRYLA